MLVDSEEPRPVLGAVLGPDGPGVRDYRADVWMNKVIP